ncbi:hypothetical protein P43SY_005486 [Pythium insidiosum]|uniref:DNA2/NAM7 helicase-like C-terminal domain-containing protein n=1 Tax=Pythium insidiosum TaxID=114742 RepID=A0AAD5L8X5_PYTIN|nr:hypothetical protein P43SY_005486 [Pythium insidiosum]
MEHVDRKRKARGDDRRDAQRGSHSAVRNEDEEDAVLPLLSALQRAKKPKTRLKTSPLKPPTASEFVDVEVGLRELQKRLNATASRGKRKSASERTAAASLARDGDGDGAEDEKPKKRATTSTRKKAVELNSDATAPSTPANSTKPPRQPRARGSAKTPSPPNAEAGTSAAPVSEKKTPVRKPRATPKPKATSAVTSTPAKPKAPARRTTKAAPRSAQKTMGTLAEARALAQQEQQDRVDARVQALQRCANCLSTVEHSHDSDATSGHSAPVNEAARSGDQPPTVTPVAMSDTPSTGADFSSKPSFIPEDFDEDLAFLQALDEVEHDERGDYKDEDDQQVDVIVEEACKPSTVDRGNYSEYKSHHNVDETDGMEIDDDGGDNQEHRFDALVIDEAAQAVEASVLIPFKFQPSRIVLVGDHQQLPATVISKRLVELGYDRSLFQRLVERGSKVFLLTQQYRMHPEISWFPSTYFYRGQLVEAAEMKDWTARKYHQSELFRPFVFVDVPTGQQSQVSGSKSLRNLSEIDVVISLLQRLVVDKYPELDWKRKIGIISPYKQQIVELRSELQRWETRHDLRLDIEVNTVDGFQGREKEIIIYSCVRTARSHQRSGGAGPEAFWADERRMNVAITRAKSSLWIIGNSLLLSQSAAWRALLQHAKETRRFIPEAELEAQRIVIR